MRPTSPEFSDGRPIARRYTCDGDDASPPLRFVGAHIYCFRLCARTQPLELPRT